MITTAVYDTKPYDSECLAQAPGAERVTTENILHLETGGAFFAGTTL